MIKKNNQTIQSKNLWTVTNKQKSKEEHCSRLHLDERNVASRQAFVANPLRINLLRQEYVGDLAQSCARPMEPKVAAALAEYRLVVVVDLLVANSAGIDRRGVRICRVEDHGLIGRVNPTGRSSHRHHGMHHVRVRRNVRGHSPGPPHSVHHPRTHWLRHVASGEHVVGRHLRRGSVSRRVWSHHHGPRITHRKRRHRHIWGRSLLLVHHSARNVRLLEHPWGYIRGLTHRTEELNQVCLIWMRLKVI